MNAATQLAHDDAWDAGDMGCGELLIYLRNRLRAMPGRTLMLTALASAAVAEAKLAAMAQASQRLRLGA